MDTITIPTHALDYKGRMQPIDWPKGKAVAQCGPVFLVQQTKTTFAVVYGLQVFKNYPYIEAAKEFGLCVMHSLCCDGAIVD